MPNDKVQMTKTRESPSPVLTLALSSKWRGESVEGEEIAASRQVGTRNDDGSRGRGKQESRSRDERLHIAGFCDDAALKLKRTLNGKSSMLLREHNPIDNSVTGDTITVQGSRV